ncbi:MAG: hypothetical protein JSW54_12325 [Fidelibacterota bacterium]|nr:MAG: hypothetical protein JSW54_12325 [Candidatus Neomarinimicrobiota bacterium]
MKKNPVITIILVLSLALLAGCGDKETKPKFSPAFTEYRTIQFITSRGHSPKSVMYLDNNGDILLACRGGATLEQLQEAGIPYTTSQLKLLEVLGLLERKDGYRTKFPILDSVQTEALRRLMDKPARDLLASIGPAIGELIEQVRMEYDNHNSSFSIAFSYILDGVVWEIMAEEGLSAPPRITDVNPFWGGEVWSLYPPRTFSSGTNTFSDQGVVFAVNWTRGIMPKLRQFWADRTMLKGLMTDYRIHGRVVDQAVLEYYRPFNIFNEQGVFTIPIVEERAGNRLYDSCRAIARAIALEVPKVLDLPAIMEAYGFDNLSQTTIIAYHELMWSITEQLEAEGLMSRPLAFKDPEHAEMADLADLILIRQR